MHQNVVVRQAYTAASRGEVSVRRDLMRMMSSIRRGGHFAFFESGGAMTVAALMMVFMVGQWALSGSPWMMCHARIPAR